jgi:histidyl-tRNA synthetase
VSSSPLQALNGFRDFYPEACRQRDRLFCHWTRSAETFGFSPYDGPPLESLELFTRKSGPEIISQLYQFTDRGEREVALRPEMTPTLARMIGARHRDYKKPIKWYAIPQVFRYERPQKGRLREHYQWNGDIIGEAGIGAEVELISLILHALQGLGLGPEEVVVRMSDRAFWHHYLDGQGVPTADHDTILQVLDKMERAPEEETRRKLGSLADPIYELIGQGEEAVREGRLLEIRSGLEAMGLADYLAIDLSIVRGLAYYTGVVFELHDRKGEFRAIAGGGRYDGLLKQLTGTDLPAVGFGMGDVVISELLQARGLGGELEPMPGYYLVIADDSVRPQALALAARLRKAGYRIDYPLAASKVGKQFQLAEELGFSQALVLDAEWKAAGVCGFKDLRKREQKQVRLEWKKGQPEWLPAE